MFCFSLVACAPADEVVFDSQTSADESNEVAAAGDCSTPDTAAPKPDKPCFKERRSVYKIGSHFRLVQEANAWIDNSRLAINYNLDWTPATTNYVTLVQKGNSLSYIANSGMLQTVAGESGLAGYQFAFLIDVQTIRVKNQLQTAVVVRAQTWRVANTDFSENAAEPPCDEKILRAIHRKNPFELLVEKLLSTSKPNQVISRF